MNYDLKDQIRELTDFIETSQTQIRGPDVRAGVAGLASTVDEPSLRRKRVLIAVSAFVLALILVGGVAWLAPLGDDAPPATEPTVTTTIPTSTTMIATEEAVELEVLSLVIGPEPRFDTSALGREVVFEPSEDDDISVQVSQLIFDSLPPGYEYPIPMDLESLEGRLTALINDGVSDATITGPIQYVGHMADLGQHVIIWEIDQGLGVSVIPGDTASSCCGGTSEDYGMWLGAGDGSTAVIVVAVPIETSVVGITEPDGTGLWQRPIGGWGMFEVAEWSQGSPGPTIDAYDDLGNQIGHWTIGSQTPVVTTTIPAVPAPATQEVTVTWTDVPQDERRGCPASATDCDGGGWVRTIVGTSFGLFGTDRFGALWRSTDGANWEPTLTELRDVSVASSGPRTLVSGLRDGRAVLLRSVDGVEWSEIDLSDVPERVRYVTETTPSGLTWLRSPSFSRDVLVTIEADRATTVHEPPWDQDMCCGGPTLAQ
jgi:hypothetical protein